MGQITEALKNDKRIADFEVLSDRLVKKWEPFLEGIETDHKRRVLSVLYENTLRDYQSRGQSILTEQTTSASAAPFVKYVFPLIRRTFANLIAPNLVSVQPMTAPVGGIFFFRYLYGTSKGEVVAGQEIAHPTFFNRFYSSDLVYGETAGMGDGTQTTFTGTLKFTPIRSKTVQIGAGLVVGTDDGNGNITGTGISGTVNYTTGAFSVTFATAPGNGVKVFANYRYVMELNPLRPTANIDIQLIEVRAKTRSLAATYSIEALDDIRALQALNAEAELTAGISAQIATEIDREIVVDLLNAALTGDMTMGPSTATFDANVPSGVSKTDHYRGILFSISKVSEEIHRKTLRSPANWIVVGPRVAALLNTLPFFRKVAEPPYVYQGALIKIGTLQENTWTVYKDPLLQNVFTDPTKDIVILGYQGSHFLDTGYVYAPYIPLQVTPTFYDPRTQGITLGFRTRYATQLVRPEFYGAVIVENANTI